MTVFKVKSSNILQIEHIDTSLIVYFKGGGLYQYKDVPESIAINMASSESAGKFLNKNIKSQYDFTKITETDVISLRKQAESETHKVQQVFFKVAPSCDPKNFITMDDSGVHAMFGYDVWGLVSALSYDKKDFTSTSLEEPTGDRYIIQKIQMTPLEYSELKAHPGW